MAILSGPAQVFGIDAHETGADQLHPLGTIGFTLDNRKYVYGKAGATELAPGKLVVTADAVANHTNRGVAAAAAGATQVTVTLGATAATANQYAEGFLVINDAAGEGIAYKIASHPAADASATLTVTLEDALQVALTTASEVSLVYNTYDNVVISATDQADMAVGVPNVTVTGGYYAWFQVAGRCAVLADEAVNRGLALTIGSSTAGAEEALDGAGEPQIGVAVDALVDTEYRAVELTIS